MNPFRYFVCNSKSHAGAVLGIVLAAAAAAYVPGTCAGGDGPDAAGTPAANDATTIIRSGDELRTDSGVDKTRAEVIRNLEELFVRRDVKGQVINELLRTRDGTPLSGIRIGAVSLSLARDEASAFSLVTTALEDHRFQTWRLLSMKRSRLADSERTRAARDHTVESIADQLARGVDEKGQALTPTQRDDMKNLLYQTILWRKDLEARCRRLTDECSYYTGELTSLKTFEERIEGMARCAAVQVERQMDAVRSEQEALVAQDVKASQEDLRKMIDALRVGPTDKPRAASEDNPVETRGVSIANAMEKMKHQLPADAEPLIETELKKAQSRLNPQSGEK